MRAGLNAVAVQSPLTSLADDVAATRRVLDAFDGPALLVGHSWAGVVITEAGLHDNVQALGYVAAAAPDTEESFNDWWAGVEPAPGLSEIVPHGDGFLVLTEEGMRSGYAHDLPSHESGLLYATQAPLKASCFNEVVSQVAWRQRPSFYLVAEGDRIINSSIQHDAAAKMTGSVVVPSSHVPMLSVPDAVGDFLIQAARSVS